MEKEKESFIATYNITLNAGVKGKIPIIPPTNKIIYIHYLIFHATSGVFRIQQNHIKHWREESFILYNSTIDELLHLFPLGIVREAGAEFSVENLSANSQTLDITLVGEVE